MTLEVLINESVAVNYSQMYVTERIEQDGPLNAFSPDAAFQGQTNGLCGAVVPGSLFLVTGPNSGIIGMRIELHGETPILDAEWEDAVEVSFIVTFPRLAIVQWDGESHPLHLEPGTYRVRYCARGMDQARSIDTNYEHPIDRYLLQLWLARAVPDVILRQGSETAAYWHQAFGDQESSPAADVEGTPESLATRKAKKRLASVNVYLGSIKLLDEDLMWALANSPDALHRRVARWSALSALTAAGMAELPALSSTLAALERGEKPSSPFDDESKIHGLLDHAIPHTSVRRIPGLGAPENRNKPAIPQLNAAGALGASLAANSLESALYAIEFASTAHGREGYRGFLKDMWRRFPELTAALPDARRQHG